MLVVFFGLWDAPGSILDGPRQVLEPSKRHLTMSLGIHKHASQKCSPCNKTAVFAMFYRLRNMPHTATKHVSCVACKAFFWTWCTDCYKKTLLAFTFCFSKPPCSAAVRAKHIELQPSGACWRPETVRRLSGDCTGTAFRILGGSGLDLGSPGTQFWRVCKSIFEGLGLPWVGFGEPWAYFCTWFWQTCGSHIWRHLLTIEGMLAAFLCDLPTFSYPT